jgi:hypothetical protein
MDNLRGGEREEIAKDLPVCDQPEAEEVPGKVDKMKPRLYLD